MKNERWNFTILLDFNSHEFNWYQVFGNMIRDQWRGSGAYLTPVYGIRKVEKAGSGSGIVPYLISECLVTTLLNQRGFKIGRVQSYVLRLPKYWPPTPLSKSRIRNIVQDIHNRFRSLVTKKRRILADPQHCMKQLFVIKFFSFC